MQLSRSKVSYPVDLWVRDDQGNAIFVVDVKFAAHSENYVSQLEAYLRDASEHDRKTIPYAMLI
jgi:hypothetical protein